MSHQSPLENHHQSNSSVRNSTGPVDTHRVYMLGAPGVGKAALITQFMTSECINAYEGPGTIKFVFILIGTRNLHYFIVCIFKVSLHFA